MNLRRQGGQLSPDYPINKENWEQWNPNVFNEFFLQTNNCVSKCQAGYFSKEEQNAIKEKWTELSIHLTKIAQEQESYLNKDVYYKIKALIRGCTKRDMRSATNRLIAGLQPYLLCTIISYDEFYSLFNYLKIYIDFPKYTGDWFDDNNNLIRYFQDKLQPDNKMDIITYPWQVLEYFKDVEKKEIKKSAKMNNYKQFLIANKNIILTGAPGTGKTYLAKEIAKLMTEKDTDEKNSQFGFVQFHPSYDYTDFVEGLRPQKPEGQNDLSFVLKDGIFMSFCKEAMKVENKDKKYVFIIDEINRGEISKIFGELFFSIDPGYRGTKGMVKTQYSNLRDEKDQYFYVPKNVYIIGTMNDIDRSVESMDFAMRRRFAWIEITAEESQRIFDSLAFIEKLNGKIDIQIVKNRMKNLNRAIIDDKLGLSKAYQIGAAYFKKLEMYVDEANPFKILWDNHLNGLLSEYLRGTLNSSDKLKTLESAYINEKSE